MQDARIRKTVAFFSERQAFIKNLVTDIHRAQESSKRSGHRCAIRLNGTSDIRWELWRGELMDPFPGVQFYDYTKLQNRRDLPSNYHLTYSLSEGPASLRYATETLRSVAVIFPHQGPLPERYLDLPVVDGDRDDLRFLDPPRVVVGLRAKGRAKRGRQPHVMAAT